MTIKTDQVDKGAGFKADGEDSSTVKPVGGKFAKRRADKDGELPAHKPSTLKEGDEEETDDDDDKDDDKDDKKGKKPDFLVKESDVNFDDESFAGLFEGSGLDDDFVSRLGTLFKAEVVRAVNEKVEEIADHAEASVQTAIDEETDEIVSRLDSYLNHIAETYLEENKVEIASQMKVELVEDFLHGMRNLFAENWIEIPEAKVDVLEELASVNQELKEELDEHMNNAIALATELAEMKKDKAINEAVVGLTDVSADKFRKLAENLNYGKEFDKRLVELKEGLEVSSSKKSTDSGLLNEEVNNVVDLVEENKKSLDPRMSHYVQTISKMSGR